MPHPRTALSGYADDRLPGWQTAVVARHLRRCTRCAVEVGQIRAVGELLRATAPQPPPGLVDRLLALGGEAAGPATAHPPADGPRAVDQPADQPPAETHGATGPGVLVAAAVLLGTVVAGAAVTGVQMPAGPLPGRPASPASATVLLTVLPRPWTGGGAPDGAQSVRPVDDGQRP